ncbi:MAG: hypothetical protein NZ480_05560 [Bdellovibrionaceae bacterium]|nr:hypothetical protein [Pseudobdellovibrionaceae bacterium]MDW8190502.1 acetyl-CoA hydrolase/transferase C-terminal domain-containing protein [Pseudobdellovibrionaceae bacterium]
MSDLYQLVTEGSRVFIHGGCATPRYFIKQLESLKDQVRGVTLYHLHTHGPALYAGPDFHKTFTVHNLFVGQNIRASVDLEHVDYIPCFLSEIGTLFRRGVIPLDLAIVQVSPPDAHGYCSLGTSVDVAKAAFDSAKKKVVLINHQMPRTHGDGHIFLREADLIKEVDEPLYEVTLPEVTEAESRIGQIVAGLVEDGSTIQTGIGGVPSAVLASLKNHKNLGVHSEMWTDALLDLIHLGVVNNSQKKVHPGKTVASFVIGTRKLFDFIHDNPSVVMLEASYVNQPNVIARNPKVVAINSCVEMDLTGQVCADSIGYKIISGVGGQMDFMRAAFLSEQGKPILAFTSRTKSGISRIVSQLRPGAGVVTTRAHVHYVVTEWGYACLSGLSINQRAKKMIELAHPEDRDRLAREWEAIKKTLKPSILQ